jgi:hypothetical protein
MTESNDTHESGQAPPLRIMPSRTQVQQLEESLEETTQSMLDGAKIRLSTATRPPRTGTGR